MVGHIDLSGTHHHNHNTDGIGSQCYLDNWTITTASMVITSATTTASAFKLTIIIALLEISVWVMI